MNCIRLYPFIQSDTLNTKIPNVGAVESLAPAVAAMQAQPDCLSV
jgi:hypothetical protein